MTVLVRPAMKDDARHLADIHAACFPVGWDSQYFGAWLAREDAFAVVAEEGGAPVAFGLALAAGEDAELLTIGCLPERRRSGLGKTVFGALDAQAGERGLVRWVLEVAVGNHAAIALYGGAGFETIGLRKDYYRHEDSFEDAHVMARPVGPRAGLPGGHRAL